MTDQEIFDRVRTHLLTQNRQARGEKGCMYRAANGDRCAIGCLIPDHLYSPDLEGKAVCSVWLRKVLRKVGIDTEMFGPHHQTLKLLADLQYTHDRFEPDQWAENLQKIADLHHLVVNTEASIDADRI